MYYEYIGQGINDPTKLRYKIGLNFYIDCNSDIEDSTIELTIFRGSFPYDIVEDRIVSITSLEILGNCVLPVCYPCINFIPSICYKVYTYETIVELAPSPSGYVITKQRCCRISNISNLVSPSTNIGVTYSIAIPGVVAGVPSSHINASPQFFFNDTSIVCGNNPFSIEFKATDADRDSLVYYFCDAYAGGSLGDPNPTPASKPPYPPVSYVNPFSGNNPLGSGVTINRITGVISGIAPDPGEYVLNVCIDEYRNGMRFAKSRKELHLKVANCAPVRATLDPTFTTCGDLTLSFSNQTDNPSIQNWLWVFNDPASGNMDTSFLQYPTHTFSAAGVYKVKLVVNKGLPCVDSTNQIVNVFPGFFPKFSTLAPLCAGQPVSFKDSTRTNYGIVNSWQWDFGNQFLTSDTSRVMNPVFTFSTAGNYKVKLVVTNSKGCKDSTDAIIIINPPPILDVFPRDTSFCGRDSILLTATGTGNFTWLPNSSIIGGNTATPKVFPTLPTTYFVTLDVQGCTNRDSIKVTPVNDLTNSITANPAVICAGDTLTLTGNSNHTTNVTWKWNPVTTISMPFNKVTQAFPAINTSYTLQTTWGLNCTVTNTISIPVTPLALANAGTDTYVCSGQSAVQLSASGGNTYSWSPSTGLNNSSIANPTAFPSSTTLYIVNVGVNGCSKTKSDSILVTVNQKPLLQLTNDTLICSIDTLQLIANGIGDITWAPNYNINNTSGLSPLVSPDIPTIYRARLINELGCFTDDSVFIDVKQSVSVNAGPDTSICKTDGFRILTTGDALSYVWTPNLNLSSDTAKNPFADPQVSTTYRVLANIGKCQAESFINIKVAPYPDANAGTDASVCIGFDTHLLATGGSSYIWSPTTFLNDPAIANPAVIQPQSNIQYIVTVTDTLGCQKEVKDSILVTVIQKLRVDSGPQDTTTVQGEPLQLRATGAINYVWEPATWLNTSRSPDPIAIPQQNITYKLTGTDAAGCQGTDTIRVIIYNIEADIYVPTAFSPTGDRLNDEFKPILLGMKSLSYFRVYNRFGELVFSTSQNGKGWNGIYKGKPQDVGTYVWVAQGITYKGQVRRKKGFVVLIR